ncbi:MAG: excinuclease ABC subunit UvrA [Planctomycetota bacterium]
MQRLVDAGNTVVVIEHSLDVIKVVDHLIELGPGGGAEGGQLIATGTPEDVSELDTPTGVALAELFRGKPRPLERQGKKTGGSGGEPEDRFVITGARENNLKNVDVEIPRGKLTVITGPSGSGKSTLAFDILFAEGQRRYVESLSTYARRFLGRMQRAHVDRVEGIAPAISIDQKNTSTSPRSTVATTTEVYDYLRLLFARVGVPHCPECDAELVSASPSVAARRIEEELAGKRSYILAPLLIEEGESLQAAAERLLKDGFVRAWVAGTADEGEVRLEELIDRLAEDDAAVTADDTLLVIDRLVPGNVDRNRLTESVEEAYRRGGDRVVVRVRGAKTALHFHRLPACPEGHFSLQEELTPRVFSFNHHSGACPRCDGLGIRRQLEPTLLINEPHLPLFKGAMDHRLGNWISNPKHRVHKVLQAACKAHEVDLKRPYEELDEAALRVIFDGTGDQVYAVRFRRFGGGKRRGQGRSSDWEGLQATVARWHRRAESPNWRHALEEFMTENACASCQGGRLRKDLLQVRVADRSIADICRLPVHAAALFFDQLELSQRDAKIAEEVMREIVNRLRFLETVGLGYLTLDRRTATLSGGEAQRIRLATQIGNRLAGVLYVLDEPTIGLHQRDNERLLESLVELRDLGNSVVIVEHDSQTIDRADHVVDLGPGAGAQGGMIVATGNPQQIRKDKRSITGPYLTGAQGLAVPAERRPGDGGSIVIKGARTNNLKSIDVSIPTGTFTVVTGVSGSGKSSLVMEILARHVEREYHGKRVVPGPHASIDGLDEFEGATVIDQAPIGRSPSSNAATYTGLFTPVRALFAKLPLAKTRGYGKGRFSYNVSGGRCEACEGKGARLIEMHFLSDIWVPCDVCGGQRYDRETLAIRFKGHTIADVLQMSVSEAAVVFENHPEVGRMLKVMEDVGLGYLPLGQSATTLSGGEAQRVKLAAALGKPRRGSMLYILDEPTTGLHFADVEKLVTVLQRFADRGDTVLVIEHNLDVIKCADYIIDLGPEGGDGGGTVVTCGAPEDVAKHRKSHTGRYVKPLLPKKTRRKKRTPA